MEIYKIYFSDYMKIRAKKMAEQLGELPNSHSKGKGNEIGYLAEEAFQIIYPKAIRVNNFDYDFILNGKKIDVKGLFTYHEPKPYHENVFRPRKENQDTDFYYFISIHASLEYGWNLGWVTREFYLKCPDVKKGEIAGSGKPYRDHGKRVYYKDMIIGKKPRRSMGLRS